MWGLRDAPAVSSVSERRLGTKAAIVLIAFGLAFASAPSAVGSSGLFCWNVTYSSTTNEDLTTTDSCDTTSSDDPDTAPFDFEVDTGDDRSTFSSESDYNTTDFYRSGDKLVIDTAQDTFEVIPRTSEGHVEVLERVEGLLALVLSKAPHRVLTGNFNIVASHAEVEDCTARIAFETHETAWDLGADEFQPRAINVTIDWLEVHHDDPAEDTVYYEDANGDPTLGEEPAAHIAEPNYEIPVQEHAIQGTEIDVWMNRTVADTPDEAAQKQEAGDHDDEVEFTLGVDYNCT